MYLFPMAIEYGMTSKEFWEDDPNLFVAFRTSFINKKKREMEEINYKCWLQGLYNHNGNSLLEDRLSRSISSMLGGKNQCSNETYPSKPYDLSPRKAKKIEEEKEERNKNYFNTFNYYATIKQRFLEKIQKGE